MHYQFLLSVDLHERGEAGHMHPVHLDEARVLEDLSYAGFDVARLYRGLDQIGRSSYGHGVALTIVARKPDG